MRERVDRALKCTYTSHTTVLTRNPSKPGPPVHASWPNQIEIYFSIVQRKVLSFSDFTDIDAVSDRYVSSGYSTWLY